MCDPQSPPRRLTGLASNRPKLWELDARLHCSVIGTCLSLEDLRGVCRRIGLQIDAWMSDYEFHHACVAMADRPLPAVRQLNKLLERKYKEDVVRLARVDDRDQLLRAWRDALDQGSVAGTYWALLTHPALPADLQARITGDVHMLSHLSGATQRADLKRLQTLERRVASLQAKLERSDLERQRRQNRHNEKIQSLRQRLREAQRSERHLADARARLDALENNDLVRRLRSQVESYAAKLAEARLACERAEAARDTVLQQLQYEQRAHCKTRELLHEVCRERDALESFAQGQLMSSCTASCANGEQRADLDLCGRCILYVGGRQNVTAHLTQLVQRCNGRLICHDGGREDSRAHLANLLPQADAVVCPLDCVSHDAYLRVKQFCKQYAKRLVLLPSASLSSFARGLQQLSPASG